MAHVPSVYHDTICIIGEISPIFSFFLQIQDAGEGSTSQVITASLGHKTPSQQPYTHLIHILNGSGVGKVPTAAAGLKFTVAVVEDPRNNVAGCSPLVSPTLANGALVCMYGLSRDADALPTSLATCLADNYQLHQTLLTLYYNSIMVETPVYGMSSESVSTVFRQTFH